MLLLVTSLVTTYGCLVQIGGLDMALRNFFKKFRKDTEGATMIEYAVLASLIAVVSIGAITTVGTKVNTTFSSVASNLK